MAAVRVLAAAGYDVALPRRRRVLRADLDRDRAARRGEGRRCGGRSTRPGVGDGDGPDRRARAVVRRPRSGSSSPSCSPTTRARRRSRHGSRRSRSCSTAPAGRRRRGDAVPALVQPHCHQQAVLGQDADARVMAAAGIEPTAVLTGCCGLAGSFGAEAGHEAVSRAVAELELAARAPRDGRRNDDPRATGSAAGPRSPSWTAAARATSPRSSRTASTLTSVAGERRGAPAGRRRGRAPAPGSRAAGSPGVADPASPRRVDSVSTAASAGSSTRNPSPCGSTAYAATVPCIALDELADDVQADARPRGAPRVHVRAVEQVEDRRELARRAGPGRGPRRGP